jgi:hypothetical protein
MMGGPPDHRLCVNNKCVCVKYCVVLILILNMTSNK